MNSDTQDFLEALLFVAADGQHQGHNHRANWTIHQFHPEFQEAVDRFISGFREYLTAKADEMTEGPESAFDDVLFGYLDNPDDCERSFGGNVFFSLSGHGVGFWDDSNGERGKALQSALEAYSAQDSRQRFEGKYRFEELESNLAKFSGKIHLAFRTAAHRREYLDKYFGLNPAPVSR
jgi:hypothetical protein